MTNLLEKSLILGFSIFTLISFLSFISPFILEVSKSDGFKTELNEFSVFMEEVDSAVSHAIKNEDKSYFKEIYFPENINLSIFDSFIKFDFILESKSHYRIIEYDVKFWNRCYENIEPGVYRISVFLENSLLDIQFK